MTPSHWKSMCINAGLEIVSSEIYPKEQPDLEWYFNAANTNPANRQKVHALISSASGKVRQFFQIKEANGKIT